MRKSLTKFTLSASIMLALTFILSCGEHVLDDKDQVNSGGCGGDDYSSSGKGGGGSSPSKNSSSSETPLVGEKGTFKDDRDSQTYKWVKIGTQIWMAQNLNYFEPWVGKTRGNKCYNSKDANCEKYGRLYEWDDAIRLCPDGWHLPTKAEWDALISAVGDDAGKKLKSKSEDWRDGAGTDTYGFGALPGGILTKEFEKLNTMGFWWTSTEGWEASCVKIIEGNNIYEQCNAWDDYPLITNQSSVRCVKGYSSSSSISYGELTDKRDNKKYKTVKIGTQNWMAQNLNYAEKGICYNSKDANCEKYGRLYDWATAMNVSEDYNTKKLNASPGQHQGICPDGWHLPTKSEWNILIDYAGDALKTLKARNSDWNDYYGTDIYGFRALPSGRLVGEFKELYTGGFWWTSTEGDDEAACVKMMEHNRLWERCHYFEGEDPFKINLSSIRCVED